MTHLSRPWADLPTDLWVIKPTGRELTDFKKPVRERVKQILEKFQKFLFYKAINIGKFEMCQQAICELIISLRIINFPTYFYLMTVRLVYFDQKKLIGEFFNYFFANFLLMFYYFCQFLL